MPPQDPRPDHQQRLRIGDIDVDLGALTVHGPNGPVRLTPKAAAVLAELARAAGTTVTRDELLERVWRGRFTTPGVVPQAISALRRAFGDTTGTPTVIDTIPRVGYRLLVPAQVLPGAFEDEAIPAVDDAPPPRVRGRRVAAWAMSAGIALLLASLLASLREPTTPASPFAGPAALATFEPGGEFQPRLSPDGRRLAYVRDGGEDGARVLALLTLGDSRSRLLDTGSGEPGQPTWSVDGRELTFRVLEDDGGCRVRSLSVDEGHLREVMACDAADAIAWDFDPLDASRMLLSQLRRGRIGASPMKALRLSDAWREDALPYLHGTLAIDLEPRFSPDGRMIAFRRSPNPTSDLWLLDREGGTPRRLTRVRARINGHAWWPDGRSLVFASDHGGRDELWRVWVHDGALERLGITDALAPDIAGDQLVYQSVQARMALARVALADDASGARPEWMTPSSGRDYAATLSPDGQRVALVSDRDGHRELWLREADGELRRLTSHRGPVLDRPLFSADGGRVLYLVREADQHAVWEHRIATGASVRVLGGLSSLREALYADDDRSLWIVASEANDFALLACPRDAERPDCRATPTRRAVLRADRFAPGQLLLATGGGTLALVDERDPTRDIAEWPLPGNEGWATAGGALWLLRSGSRDARLERWMPGADGPERSWALDPTPPLLYGRPAISPDGRHAWFPGMVEARSDIAQRPLAPE